LPLTVRLPRKQGVTGVASVIDGDIIEIHDQRIRPYGIDAPESSQLCVCDYPASVGVAGSRQALYRTLGYAVLKSRSESDAPIVPPSLWINLEGGQNHDRSFRSPAVY
jgi:hypothetical protein